MSPAPRRKDLVVLAADKNIEFTVRGLLDSRTAALGIRRVVFDVYPHPERDPGCRLKAHEFLRVSLASHEHALVLFDRAGCGKESVGRAALEREVEERLAASGWCARAAAIVMDPELEAWIWADSPHVERLVGWAGARGGLRGWLEGERVWQNGAPKPHDPKSAVERTLYRARKPRSSALYQLLAQQVGFSTCADPAFQKMRSTLQAWFRP
jgi:hypothetical protein